MFFGKLCQKSGAAILSFERFALFTVRHYKDFRAAAGHSNKEFFWIIDYYNESYRATTTLTGYTETEMVT